MQIGILQCGHFPTADGYPDRTYSDLYASLLADRGLSFRTYSVVDMEFPSSPDEAAGWLISGSKHGAYEDLPFIPALERFIRKIHDAEVPLVGVCFGHQITAQALGGRVEKYEGGWSVGRVEYNVDGALVPLVAWHQDQVVAKPDTANVVAQTDFCKFAALAYGDNVLTMQAHPEFDDEVLRLLLDVRAPGVVPDEIIKNARANLGKDLRQDWVADRIEALFKGDTHG